MDDVDDVDSWSMGDLAWYPLAFDPFILSPPGPWWHGISSRLLPLPMWTWAGVSNAGAAGNLYKRNAYKISVSSSF